MALSKEFEDLYFPHDDVRPIQSELIKKIHLAVSTQQNLVVHAPTGLGKTAAALAPSIKEALKKDLTIFFLTSRHTHHKLAMQTVHEIRDKYNLNLSCVDIIAKKWLCLQPDVIKLSPREFSEYCRRIREDSICQYYLNSKDKTDASKTALASSDKLRSQSRTDTESVIEESKANSLCPYEVTLLLAKKARVVIGDYYYIFHPKIRESLLAKISKEIGKIIVIVDEAHNLPDRIKELASSRTSSFVVNRAVEEAKKVNKPHIVNFLEDLSERLEELSAGVADERYIAKEELVAALKESHDYDEIISDMLFEADLLREQQKQSYLGSVASFLEEWEGVEEGFARILTKAKTAKGENLTLITYRCLDPSMIARDVIRAAHSTILMSGTLSPTHMYKEVLGFDSADETTLQSPFPMTNRLNLIIPKTSTKYEMRSSAQYKEIADILAKVCNKIPGNVAVFFPSYQLKDDIFDLFARLSEKTVFSERSRFTKKEKLDFLESFKGYSQVGAVLFGVIGGNFAEGVDLPGDLLKGVVIVGLPLQRPDLETQALIKYYESKFGKGWDYGYLLPAFNRALQSAGRCIRTESDKGVIVFLDERYAWKNYMRCFPADWQLKVSLLYEKLIEDFFSRK